jgi:hypothetical protein
MKELLQRIRHLGQFDLIRFDTPPVLALADTPLLAKHLDGLNLLVSLYRVSCALSEEPLVRISSTRAPCWGWQHVL